MPVFWELCLSVQSESLGLPDRDTASYQALARRYHHRMIEAIAEATSIFDLRIGEASDNRLRGCFGFHYVETVRRWTDNIPLSRLVIHAIEHNAGKNLLDLAEDEAK